jgi:hypothetical protein
VAKLLKHLSGGRWLVAVDGQLGAADLRRLERACAPALEYRPPPLDLKLDAVTSVDETARMFVRSLLASGAALVGRTAPEWREWLQHGGAGAPLRHHR